MTSEDSPFLIPMIIGGFLIVFPLLWCFIVFLLSRLSGWGALAQHYGVDDMPSAHSKKLRSAFLSAILFPVNYNFVLSVSVDQQALYIRPFFLFRIGHQTLRLPFDDIEAEENIRWFFYKVTRLRVRREPSIKIRFLQSDWDWISSEYDKLTGS